MSEKKVLLEEQFSVEAQRLTEINIIIHDDIEKLEGKIVENLKKTLNVYSSKEEGAKKKKCTRSK